MQVHPEAFQQLGRGRLYDSLLGHATPLVLVTLAEYPLLGGELAVAVEMVVRVVGIINPDDVEGEGAGADGFVAGIIGGLLLVVLLLYVLVLVDDGVDVVDEGLPEHRDVLVLVVQLLLAVVGGGEPLPGEGVDEERVLLEVLLERVLLGDDPGVVVVVDVVAVVGDVGGGRQLVLAVLGIVELLVREVVEGEVAAVGGRGVDGAPLPRAEAEHRAHRRTQGWLLVNT